MGDLTGWLRMGMPVLVLLGIAALLIWIIGAFLGFVIKLLIGSLVVVGFVALVRSGMGSQHGVR